jgi:hypothetical protein
MYMTAYLVISLPKVLYLNRVYICIYMVLDNPVHEVYLQHEVYLHGYGQPWYVYVCIYMVLDNPVHEVYVPATHYHHMPVMLH